MVRNSNQSWDVGATVRVGFLRLTVQALIPTPGDGLPDEYLLTNAGGNRVYAFTPHNGLQLISLAEAQQKLAAAQAHAARVAAESTLRAADAARIKALFAEVA